MKKFLTITSMICMGVWAQAQVQQDVADTMAIPGTVVTRNIRYATADPKQDLDVYKPVGVAGSKLPLVIWIHGGGWRMGGKKNMDVVAYLVGHGYAIASVGYRYSQDSVFPAQIRDCYAAVGYIFKHAAELGVDTARVVVAGASAGGHLASLLGMSLNNKRRDFGAGALRAGCIKAVINFYGPGDMYAFHGDGAGYNVDSAGSSVSKLLGAPCILRPDLAKWASPATYVDRGDPPVLILHGDKDPIIHYYLGVLFYNVLRTSGVRAQLITIPGGGHGGPEFSDAARQAQVLDFLKTYLL